jgi:hypothetical protein
LERFRPGGEINPLPKAFTDKTVFISFVKDILGIDIDTIVKATGLKQKEIEELQ